VKQLDTILVKTGNIPDALIRKISQPLISRKDRIRRLKEKQWIIDSGAILNILLGHREWIAFSSSLRYETSL